MRKVLVSLLIIVIIVGASLLGFNYYVNNVPSASETVVLDIPKGSGLRTISSILEDAGVVKNEYLFVGYVMSKGWQQKLKAGEYRFEKGSTISRIAQKITNGDVVLHQVTIPEGLTIKEIANLLDENGMLDGEEFLHETQNNKEFLSELPGRPLTGLEGYMFPDTYTYTKGVTAREFIGMMINRFNEVYRPLRSEREEINLTDNEIIILASIIEEETGSAPERPLVSAVFHNRLKRGMRLESDPTVIYGIGEDFDGNLTKNDLRTKTTYNTYIVRGLPPGPISNPGEDSILAALNPADVSYIYFVSRGDGTHYFSSNYKDHQRAVIKYQR